MSLFLRRINQCSASIEMAEKIIYEVFTKNSNDTPNMLEKQHAVSCRVFQIKSEAEKQDADDRAPRTPRTRRAQEYTPPLNE